MAKIFFFLFCISILWWSSLQNICIAARIRTNVPGIDTNYAVCMIRYVTDKMFMQVSGNIYYNEKYNDGSKIVLNKAEYYKDEAAGWQQWYIIYNGTVGGIRYYYIRNVFSGKLLDVLYNASHTGTQLQQYYKADSLSGDELWSFQRVDSSGNVFIINKKTGLALTRPSINDTSVMLEPLRHGKNQQWLLMSQPAVAYRDDDVVRFFNRNNRNLGSVAFDEGMSIPLHFGDNKGKVLWVTQDAWDGAALLPNNQFDCNSVFEYRNSILIQPSLTDWNPGHTLNIIREGSLQQRPKQICDIMPDTEFAWPGVGVEIGNHVYMQCGEGDGLIVKKQSLYDLTESAGNLWKVKRTVPEGLRADSLISYSAGMIKSDDGYVYVFGTMAKNFGYTLNVYVARFPVTNPQLWAFWNGSSWAETPVSNDSAKITDGLGSTSIAFVHGKYVLITMDQGFNCDSTRNIYVAVSDSPTGPFNIRKKVYSICEYMYGSYARYYTSGIHPEFDNGRNELLVTYCLNYSGCGISSCNKGYMDPYFYRIKGIRIPYSQIGL